MSNTDVLTTALDELDKVLTQQGLTVEIVICGAYAVYLHKAHKSVFTHDVDSLKPLESQKIFHLIEQVGSNLGLGSKWLNDQASTITIPDGTLERAKPLKKWQSINASLIDRGDLIKMKAAAFSIRREQTIKDWEDLEALLPSENEILAAIEFLKKSFSPPDGSSTKIKNEFKETLDDLEKLIKKN